MEFKKLFGNDDRAVSPVIGVILMVAITVILAAVIGTFVLGLGNQMGGSAPQASFSADFSGSALNITHAGGDTLTGSELSVVAGGDSQSSAISTDSSITAGVEVVSLSDENYASGDTIQIIWTNPEGGDTSVLYETTAP